MRTDHHEPWPAGEPPAAEFCGEETRLSVLQSYGLDALEDDPELAQITRFAARLCDAPIALVSLVESERQRFLARAGLEERETPRPTSFCAHAMLEPRPMIVRDAREDPRFSTNPLVTGHPHIRLYAGAPLISQEGAPLGSLCIIDSEPRPEGLTEVQVEGLEVLAAAVMRRLRYRREHIAASARLSASQQRVAMLADNMPDIAWSCSNVFEFDFYNARWREFTGIDGPSDAEGWRPLVHPDEQEAVFANWYSAVETGEEFESEYRMRDAAGEWRWVLSRALPLHDEHGHIERWFGTVTEIDDQRRISEQRDLLSRELSHRIKNIFAVIAGLVSIRARKSPEAADFAADLTDAIRALGRAHDYVRPGEGRKGDRLVELIAELMSPYRRDDDDRLLIRGAECAIGARAATPLALVFHELATNSAKYGALATDDGMITVDVAVEDDMITVAWRERGGQEVVTDGPEGFGSRLVKMSIEGQLGGTIERHWRDGGVDVDIRVPLKSISS